MPDKLTDNEIIKALECCANHDNVDACDDCPCQKGKCISTTPYVLDLINRKDEEINQLQEEKEALINGQETLQKYIAEQKAENERLEIECEKQYEIAQATIRAEIADGGTSCHWCEDTIKSEAYKEFAERLKELFATEKIDRCYIVLDEDIDNLLKELVGEGDV